MQDLVPIRRALISVSDKTGILELARTLARRGVEIISTGGTAKLLSSSGVRVTNVEDLTHFPEMMDGRVKTLHPLVHGGILAIRDLPEHQCAMKDHGILPIDLVCVSLYPFEQTIAKPGCTREEAVENIDVGGPTMIRAAAKNHPFVAVLTSPDQYAALTSQLESHEGATTLALRKQLAASAFERTATYDRAIADYLAKPEAAAGAQPDDPAFPAKFEPNLVLAQSLRYGENPHQRAALYRDHSWRGPSIAAANQLHGKELSYNNLNDGAAALALAIDLARAAPSRTAAAIIKHANPCGAASAHTAAHAVEMAFRGDPIAAYGGILALTGHVDRATAQIICRTNQFLEVVIAPGFDDQALELLRERSANIRLLSTGPLTLDAASKGAVAHDAQAITFRSIAGGALVQSADQAVADPRAWQHRAGPAPSQSQLDSASIIWTIVKHVSSNAVALGGPDPSDSEAGPNSAGSVRLFGAGAGQMDRVTSSRLAVEKAGALALGAVACSDAFFPFADGPKLLIDAGVTCIVHTGGSKRDADTFDLCNQRGVTCLTTGIRHFRH